MARCYLSFSAFALTLFSVAFPALAQETRANEGISFTPPARWRLLEDAELKKQSSRRRVSATEKQDGALVPAIFAKHGKAYQGLNPTIHIQSQPLLSTARSGTGRQLLEVAFRGLQRSYRDATREGAISELRIDESEGAELSSLYTVETKRGPQRARSKTVVLLREGHYFLIRLSAPANGPDDSLQTFNDFLASIRFPHSP